MPVFGHRVDCYVASLQLSQSQKSDLPRLFDSMQVPPVTLQLWRMGLECVWSILPVISLALAGGTIFHGPPDCLCRLIPELVSTARVHGILDIVFQLFTIFYYASAFLPLSCLRRLLISVSLFSRRRSVYLLDLSVHHVVPTTPHFLAGSGRAGGFRAWLPRETT
jgi:hypothetical protein